MSAGAAAAILMIAAAVGRLCRSDRGCLGRSHEHPLGQIPSVDFVYRGSVVHRDGVGLHHAQRLEPGR